MQEGRDRSGPGDAEATALAWYVRLTSGEASEADWAAHAEWLAESEAHLAAFTAVQVRFERVDAAGPAARERYTQGAGEAWPLGMLRRPVSRRLLFGGAAMALVLAATGLLTWHGSETVRYATARGEVRQVALADGSTVNLDADTEVKVTFERDRRLATLERGRAIFDVRHDPARPFVLTAGNRQVHVLGTRFEVSMLDDRFSVTVTRGRIGVSPRGSAQPIRPENTVSAGQRLVYLKDGAAPQRDEVATADVGRWSDRWLTFVAAPLKTVLAEANRYFPEETLRTGSPAVAGMTFTGSLHVKDAQTLASNLAAFMALSARREGDHFVLDLPDGGN
jgi:transmembrane sensor